MIPSCIEVYPDRAAWLAARRRLEGSCPHTLTGHYRIGASDIGRILGVSPHGGPWDVWLDKREGRAEEDNADMAQGRRWEARVLEDYAEETGAQVLSPTVDSPPAVRKGVPHGESSLRHEPCGGVILRHAELPWATCSPDGFVSTTGLWCGGEEGGPCWCGLHCGEAHRGAWAGVECKAVMDPGAAALWEEETQVIEPGNLFDRTDWPAPPAYCLQVYWSLAVTGLPFWDLAAILMPRRGRLVYHRFLADAEYQAALLAQVGAWRQRHLVEGVEPEIDDSAAAWSYYASRPHEAPLREATPEELALALELHRAQKDEADAKKRKERLRNELASRIRGVAGVALGPAVGRKKPPRAVWQHQKGSTHTVVREATDFIRLWGLSTEEET